MYNITFKDWGCYQIITVGEGYLTKILTFNGFRRTSIQRHQHRTEVWMCVNGVVSLQVYGTLFEMYPGDTVKIEPNQWHQAWGDAGSQAVEVWCGVDLREDDIERK